MKKLIEARMKMILILSTVHLRDFLITPSEKNTAFHLSPGHLMFIKNKAVCTLPFLPPTAASVCTSQIKVNMEGSSNRCNNPSYMEFKYIIGHSIQRDTMKILQKCLQIFKWFIYFVFVRQYFAVSCYEMLLNYHLIFLHTISLDLYRKLDNYW